LKVGAKVQLSETFTPAYATNKTGVWSSDATDKATVDQNGLVTGKAVGSANITFTTNDGAKKATKAVSVTAAS
ncbi:Ig-like domain-containing protein, partial [Klebsiella pneumoniae]